MENDNTQNQTTSENTETEDMSAKTTDASVTRDENVQAVIDELNDKYLRCYAEFENYKKRVNKDKEELVKYANESLLYELLPAIDSLELALKHAADSNQSGIVQGVEMTLKELHRTLEKFGLSKIDAEGRRFDPAIHHAMMNVERADIDEKLVAEELRAGYTYRDKVLRPSLVAVSVKSQLKNGETGTAPEATSEKTDAERPTEDTEIKINKKIEEEE